jgi:predicted transcriptional regulator
MLEKFSARLTPGLLMKLSEIADSQGRELQTVFDEALRDYIDRHRNERHRRQVAASFTSSLEDFDDLYRELAK